MNKSIGSFLTFVLATGLVPALPEFGLHNRGGMATCHAQIPADVSHESVLGGQSNFRDVGGYETVDGKRVAKGLVYRSGHLSKISEQDVKTLEKLGINTVVNFLTPVEIEAAGADRLPKTAKEIAAPIESDDGLAALILEARQKADFSKISPDVTPSIHRQMIADARDQYAELFRQIIRTKEPLVFHCSHGVHRTGTAAAVLLWSLGVPWDTVREDYLLSNEYRAAEVQQRLEQFRNRIAKREGLPTDQVDMSNIEAFYILQGSYIDASRDEILQRYGSIDRFVTEGLGLSQAEFKALRNKMLH